MDYLSARLAWMAWTWQTALFFVLIAMALAFLLTLAVLRPETPRVGILRFATTRGDRFFVSLLVTAFIFLLSIKIGVENFAYPAIAALIMAAVMFRFA